MRAAIALEKMTREGIHLDSARLQPLRANLNNQLLDLLNQIRAKREWLYPKKKKERERRREKARKRIGG